MIWLVRRETIWKRCKVTDGASIAFVLTTNGDYVSDGTTVMRMMSKLWTITYENDKDLRIRLQKLFGVLAGGLG
jgi:hypothetical protein